MPIDKPTIVYDFTVGRVAERLPELAVVAMVENGVQDRRKFWLELSALFRAKPIQEVRPRQVLNIVTRYVNVRPLSYLGMERVIGKTARYYLPPELKRQIPELMWLTLDYMDHLDKVNNDDLGTMMRKDIDRYMSSRVRSDQYTFLILRYLSLSNSKTTDVRAYAAGHPLVGPRSGSHERAITA